MHLGSKNKQIQKKALAFAFLLLTALAFPLPCNCTSKDSDEGVPSVNGPLRQSQTVRLSFESAYMGIKVPFMVYLPKGYGDGEKYPVWYGLHGYSSSENMWLQTAGVGRTADEMIERGEIRPLIMVFPLTRYDPAKAIREDLKDGKRDASQMERFLCGELIPYVDSHYNTIQLPDGRYIGGFSMGGYFALEIAFRHPDLFSKVGGYSPALMYGDFSGGQLEKWLYPDNNAEEIFETADFIMDKGLDKLQVYIDCGSVNEPFSDGAQSLYGILQKLGISVEFHMHEGGHSLQLGKMEEYLLFFSGMEHAHMP